MKKSLLKIVSLSAGNLLSPPLLKPNPNYINKSILSISPIYLQKARFLTTKNNAPNKTPDKKQPDSGPDLTHNKSGPTQVEDVSKEELKSRINKFLEGDVEAIPDIFEAILKRKLAGKHDESDDEIIHEFKARAGDASDGDVTDKDYSDDSSSNESLSDESLSDEGCSVNKSYGRYLGSYSD